MTLLALALSLGLLLLGSPGRCQQVSPLQGRGFPPENGTEVFTSVIIDRLLSVDDINYRFQAMLYFQLSWRDPRARAAQLNATLRAAQSYANGGSGCGFPCSSLFAWTPGSLCCEDVFLPGIEFVNAFGFSQDRPQRYRVVLPEEGDAVVWWSYVMGEYYTPLTFKAFPFDKQYLLVQCQYANRNTSNPVRFIPSATGTELNRPRTGDDFSGWQINDIGVYPFNFTASIDKLIRESGTTESHLRDPWPLNPRANASTPAFNSILWTEGFDVVITVERISLYYFIVAVIPVAVTVWLALLIFFVSPKHLDTRIGCVITMFLALTAIQFVIASQLPSSSTVVPTQQLVLVSYVVLALIGIFSIVVYFVSTADKQREKREQRKVASRRFDSRWSTFTGSVGGALVSGAAAARSRYSLFRQPHSAHSAHSMGPQGSLGGSELGLGRPGQGGLEAGGVEAPGGHGMHSTAQQEGSRGGMGGESDGSFGGKSVGGESEARSAGGRSGHSMGAGRLAQDWQKKGRAGRDSAHFGGVGVHCARSDSGRSSADGGDSYRSGSEDGGSGRDNDRGSGSGDSVRGRGIEGGDKGSGGRRRGKDQTGLVPGSRMRLADSAGGVPAGQVSTRVSWNLGGGRGIGNCDAAGSGNVGGSGGGDLEEGGQPSQQQQQQQQQQPPQQYQQRYQQQQQYRQQYQQQQESGAEGASKGHSRGSRRQGSGTQGCFPNGFTKGFTNGWCRTESCTWLQKRCHWLGCFWEVPAGWFGLQHLKWKEMLREAREDSAYANFLANKIDRCVFWVVLVGYNVAIALIFGIGSTKQPTLPYMKATHA